MGLIPDAFRISRDSSVNRGSRSWIRYFLSFRNPENWSASGIHLTVYNLFSLVLLDPPRDSHLLPIMCDYELLRSRRYRYAQWKPGRGNIRTVGRTTQLKNGIQKW